MYDQLIPFIWFAGFAILGYFIIHKFSDVIVTRIKYTQKTKNYSNDKNIDDQLGAFIENAPRLLSEIHKEIASQKESGVSDVQMKGLISKQNMLQFLVDNKEIIDIIGKPIIKKLVGFIKAI